MSRDGTLYASMTKAANAVGQDVSTPAAGYFRFKLRSKAIVGGVRIWFGPPLDPETGEEMDRSWRWQAQFDGELIEFEDVWPACTGEPISEADYHNYCLRRRWAQRQAPKSALAQPTRRYDPLSTSNPLPF